MTLEKERITNINGKYLPQSFAQLGGFKVQGRTAESALEIVEDAVAIEKACGFAILVEGVPPEVGKIITEVCKIPILSIDTGMYVDGQCLIISDMLALFEAFTPKFVRKYANLAEIIQKAVGAYIEGEADKLKVMVKRG